MSMDINKCDIWLSANEACELLGISVETLRRNCKAGKFVSLSKKSGKFKKYNVLLSSLPEKAQDKYYSNLQTKEDALELNLEIYSGAPNFKSLYLKEGAPSAFTFWLMTLGYARKFEYIEASNFPKTLTFKRKLESEIPLQSIYLARYGQAAWNKKFARYIERDYSTILAGSCWVSDHAQIDVAVKFQDKTIFPWVTVFRDFKSSKWLGWLLHADLNEKEILEMTKAIAAHLKK